MNRVIPYGRQDISEADIESVVDVLRSDFLTQGPVVPQFEQGVREICGARHAVAACNATSALHLACSALDVGPGDIVWTSPISFVASANCALYCGASVDFVDIDPSTYNMSAGRLEEMLQQASRAGKLPKVVIPVHLAGRSCDMMAIGELADRYGFKVIEDASHVIGGSYRGSPVGNCRYSDITVFSFHPVKIITTGEGGMAVTNDEGLAARMRLLRSHGISRDERTMTSDCEGPWYYEQLALGFNYRMNDVQAALGLSQLRRLESFLEKRHALSRRYSALLKPLPVTTPAESPDVISGMHLYVIRLDLASISATRRGVVEHLHRNGVLANVHYIPIYRQPYYKSRGWAFSSCPNAESYYREAISLPLYPGLTPEMQQDVVNALAEAVFR